MQFSGGGVRTMDDNTPQNNEHPLGVSDEILSEANLWNPLWVYDLFPPSQTFWSRMPITGADFQTESSASKPDPNQPVDPSPEIDNQEADDSSNNDNKDDDKDNDSSGNGNDDKDVEPETETGETDEDEPEETEPKDDGSDGHETDLDEDESELGDNSDDAGNSLDNTNPDRSNEYALEGPKQSGPPPIPGFTIIETDEGIDYFREFNSWEDFVECVADDNLYAWKNRRASHDANQGTAGAAASFTEAVEMARSRGWPEGRNLLSDLMANITTKNEAFEIWDLDVAGIFPIVPAFLSGDPACMIVDPMNELRTQYPVIRIDYNHEVAWNITPEDMITRGAAVLSLANNLEAHGFQTELRVVGNSTGIRFDRHGYAIKTIAFKYSIIYKKPGQFLDIDRAAYAIAHPSCLRRLCFALLEQHADLEASFSFHYGSPTDKPVDPDSGNFGTIFVHGSHGNETPEKSKKAVMEAADATTSMLETH